LKKTLITTAQITGDDLAKLRTNSRNVRRKLYNVLKTLEQKHSSFMERFWIVSVRRSSDGF